MSKFRPGLLIGLVLLANSALLAELPPAAKKTIDFEADIQPILAAKCQDCHGEDVQEGNFRLDRKASLLRGGDSGEPGVALGKSAESHLIRLVSGLEADLRMPPDESDALSAAEIGLLRAWVDQGAAWPGPNGEVTEEKRTTDHWAFQPVQPVEVPAVSRDWAQNPIDHFILAKLNEKGLSPNPPADRRTLIRRMSLDVLGLPVDPEVAQAFAQNEDPQAVDALIESMLASQHYGERWATHWLDLVRFAETYGFETNRERPHAWHYRDYVIDSLNEDKPYDQFVREQIAGDSFGNRVGLSYLVAGPYDIVKSPDINLTLMQRQNELDDIINTTSTTFLGLTVGCARCHNHKFDPILQTDYYSMQAIFAGVQHADMQLPLSPQQQNEAESLRQKIATLEQQLSAYIRPHETGQFVLIDDAVEQAGDRIKLLAKLEGKGVNHPGTERGQANDPGDTNRNANLSGGKYSWWKHQPDQPVLAWQPRVEGKFRVWLSWGCGYDTHCQDARYVIDRDGDPTTRDDWEVIAIVNQQQFADGVVDLRRQPLWSGFLNATIADFDANDQILLVGGKTGTALTADALVLEKVSEPSAKAPAKPVFREAVRATGNVEKIAPTQAKFVRFVIEETNGAQACLDELSIFSSGKNVGLASEGGKPTASGSLSGYPIHKLEHINDGQFSNSRSWIADSTSNAWVQIELAKAFPIDRIEWSRDREGQYADRLPIRYRVETSLDGVDWTTVASSADRLPATAPQPSGEGIYRFDHLADDEALIGRALLADLKIAQSELKAATNQPTVYAGRYEQPGPTHRLYRGEALAKREEVAPNAPEIFTNLMLGKDSPEAERRKKLAEWIASPENPLTARVLVNRIWQFHFGRGLVDTPSDFGQAGVPPTHPQLLDWLAGELVNSGWSMKHIHRLILQSATYQQSSRPAAEALKVDGATRLLWRYPPRRLEAEPIRDSILASSGVLDLKKGGPGFSAFEVEAENVRHYHPKTSFGPEDWRRMVYMTKVRMEKDAVFGLFDCPDAATSVAQRSRSTTPLQALNLFNSTFLLQQADLFAQRLEEERATVEQRIERAFEICYARQPSAEELNASRTFVEQQGLIPFCRALLNSNEFLFIQ
ncbi:DUF1553 domain-containing protein [Bremerella cremea]|uniref:DUF1553 domain-containing protein n=1 Tax=Bremerella cremea TaxID=1031537 RepID=A0A368KS21_9BACT|nr:DUF1553 domain-containing protein [Bremerella cremea]RCS44767.1 DUF1553 domain-containing protein [Bremerella cremea]